MASEREREGKRGNEGGDKRATAKRWFSSRNLPTLTTG
jgi:hypothetical protein